MSVPQNQEWPPIGPVSQLAQLDLNHGLVLHFGLLLTDWAA